VITKKDTFNDFVADLQDVLKVLRIGILRVEKVDLESLRFTLTVAEDLDCSGLPVCNETICTYDEGFISASSWPTRARSLTSRKSTAGAPEIACAGSPSPRGVTVHHAGR